MPVGKTLVRTCNVGASFGAGRRRLKVGVFSLLSRCHMTLASVAALVAGFFQPTHQSQNKLATRPPREALSPIKSDGVNEILAIFQYIVNVY
jgi:hypothetical protein